MYYQQQQEYCRITCVRDKGETVSRSDWLPRTAVPPQQTSHITSTAVMLNQAKILRPRPKPRPGPWGRDRDRGQSFEVKAEAEAEANFLTSRPRPRPKIKLWIKKYQMMV